MPRLRRGQGRLHDGRALTDQPGPSARDRLLEAAYEQAGSVGWAAVRMAKVAEAAGLSRQTAYNEFGTKHGLAEQLALRELARFLGEVRRRMEGATDVVDAVREACEGALLLGEQNVLVRSITGTGGDDDFLALLTTESGALVEGAAVAVQQNLHELFPPVGLTPDRERVVVESVIRLLLSAMTRPSKPPAEAASDIAWLFGHVLRGAAG